MKYNEEDYSVFELIDVLMRNGFVPCDNAYCNCGSWHHRYGLPERFAEIKEALADAEHPVCNENGNSVLKALESLIEERDFLAGELRLAAMYGFYGNTDEN